VNKNKLLLGLAFGMCLSFGAQAQTLTGLKLEPAQVKVGEPVKATISFEASGSYNCGVSINWGDGNADPIRIQSEKDVPKVITHTYTKPGNFKAEVYPDRISSSLKCVGKDKPNATVAVVAPAPVAAPAAPAAPAASAAKPAASAAKPVAAAPAGPACPAGWTLNKASVNKKTKAFTCTAKAGTAAPADKLACPGDLGYFENVKKGQIGCRP
jgi:hypothetical protein